MMYTEHCSDIPVAFYSKESDLRYDALSIVFIKIMAFCP
jgi:hypothetical protein